MDTTYYASSAIVIILGSLGGLRYFRPAKLLDFLLRGDAAIHTEAAAEDLREKEKRPGPYLEE